MFNTNLGEAPSQAAIPDINPNGELIVREVRVKVVVKYQDETSGKNKNKKGRSPSVNSD